VASLVIQARQCVIVTDLIGLSPECRQKTAVIRVTLRVRDPKKAALIMRLFEFMGKKMQPTIETCSQNNLKLVKETL
jgi:hypothetical protein